METKHLQKLSIVALIISVLPLATLIPVLLNITLTDGLQSIWAGVNIFSAIVGLILSIICVKNRNSRSTINVVSTIVSGIWVLMMVGIVALALFLNFVQ